MDRTTKRAFGRICLGLPLLYGLVPVIFASVALRKWVGVSNLVVLFCVLFFLGGIVMVSSALWLLVSVGRARLPLWIGGMASILNAGILAWATLTDLLPCSGPD